MLMALEKSSLRINVDADLHTKWTKMCEQKRITQQDAMESLLGWFIGQDDLAQSGVLRQINLTPSLLELLCKRRESGRFRGGGSSKQNRPSAAEQRESSAT